MEPEAPRPLDTLTFVPSSRYLTPTLQGFLQKQTKTFTLTIKVGNKTQNTSDT